MLQLEKGQLLTVSANLVKRLKQHFYYLEQYGVQSSSSLGCNTYFWVGAHSVNGGKMRILKTSVHYQRTKWK
ncbi:hypothetical protein AMTRI_Chr01g127300 [Amborella trichopoda]